MSLHITVAAIVKKNDKYLFVEEKIGDGVYINQPAGHLEINETVIDAVVRETFEESGWHVKAEYLTGIYQLQLPESGKSYIRFCFYCTALNHDSNAKLDKEIIRTHWLSESEFNTTHLQHRSPLVQQSLIDYLKGNNFPLSMLHNHEF